LPGTSHSKGIAERNDQKRREEKRREEKRREEKRREEKRREEKRREEKRRFPFAGKAGIPFRDITRGAPFSPGSAWPTIRILLFASYPPLSVQCY
jgi:hypothetical protein